MSKELLDILVCPKCKGELDYDRKAEKLICRRDKLRFGIIEGSIPNMLLDEAEKF
ncbi:MAG: Trm112 family protein [Candidatus Aenigmatarchaeota archaeon]